MLKFLYFNQDAINYVLTQTDILEKQKKNPWAMNAWTVSTLWLRILLSRATDYSCIFYWHKWYELGIKKQKPTIQLFLYWLMYSFWNGQITSNV